MAAAESVHREQAGHQVQGAGERRCGQSFQRQDGVRRIASGRRRNGFRGPDEEWNNRAKKAKRIRSSNFTSRSRRVLRVSARHQRRQAR